MDEGWMHRQSVEVNDKKSLFSGCGCELYLLVQPRRLKRVQLQSRHQEICVIGSSHCPSLRRWVSRLPAAVKQMRVEVQWARGTEAKKWTRRGRVAVSEGRFT